MTLWVLPTESRLFGLCQSSNMSLSARAGAGGLCSGDFNRRTQIAAVIGLICTTSARLRSCSASGNTRVRTDTYKPSAGRLHSIHRESHAVMHANPIISGDATALQSYSSGPWYSTRRVSNDQVHTDVEMLAGGWRSTAAPLTAWGVVVFPVMSWLICHS